MQLIIDISDNKIEKNVLNFLKKWQGKGLEILRKEPSSKQSTKKLSKTLDFSAYGIDCFRETEGMEYQRRIRDEW